MHGGDDSAADLALCNLLAFWTGCQPDRIDRLFRQSGLYRQKWERDDYRERTIRCAIESTTEVYTSSGCSGGVTADGSSKSIGAHELPVIFIDTDEHRVICETIEALRADPGIYYRGSMLVRVLRDCEQDDGIQRTGGSPVITELPAANLRERMTEFAYFEKMKKNGPGPAHPAPWLVAGVDKRGEWPGFRHLRGISDSPILRPDGSIFQTPGYDRATGVLYEPSESFPTIDSEVDGDDAAAAIDTLNEVVCDFRFENPDHHAAWLAGLLTPLARFAFPGPSPLFLIDANIRAAGKGLLAQTIGLISLGRVMPVSSYAHDSEEMRKKITAIAIAGDRMVLLDNLEGIFGNDALNRALTTTRWKDRILGKSEQVDLPLIPVWYATGNNVAVAAETARRIIHIRLDVLEERPEERSDFCHPHLMEWIIENRPRLLNAALTILVAFYRAGKPQQDIPPYGSFEGWSKLVRQCVVWVGLPDPCRTREQLAASADSAVEALSEFISAWQVYDPGNEGIVLGPLLARLYPPQRDRAPTDEASVRMRTAIESLVGGPPGRIPTARSAGRRLSTFRRRVIGGVYLDVDPNTPKRMASVWKLYRPESRP